MIRIITTLIFLWLFALCSCRSPQALLDKAIERGLSIDTAWRTKVDTVKAPGDSIKITVKEVDTVKVQQLCDELKTNPKKALPPLQDEICPQVDSVYRFKGMYRGVPFYLFVKVDSKGGNQKVSLLPFDLPIVRQEGTTTITPGIPKLRVGLMVTVAIVFGLMFGFGLGLVYKRK